MPRRLFTRAEQCPRPEGTPVAMAACGACRFFRGAASSSHEPRGWEICCNWPRSGSFLAASTCPVCGGAGHVFATTGAPCPAKPPPPWSHPCLFCEGKPMDAVR